MEGQIRLRIQHFKYGCAFSSSTQSESVFKTLNAVSHWIFINVDLMFIHFPLNFLNSNRISELLVASHIRIRTQHSKMDVHLQAPPHHDPHSKVCTRMRIGFSLMFVHVQLILIDIRRISELLVEGRLRIICKLLNMDVHLQAPPNQNLYSKN